MALGNVSRVILAMVLAVGMLPAQTRDSAGIRIVESSGPTLSAPRAWRLAPRPVLDIGGGAPDGPQDVDGILPVIELTDGRIVLFHSRTGSVRFHDASGRMLGTVGRRGEGPGEFRSMVLFRGRGDTVMAYDPGNRRLTVIDPRMKIVRMMPLLLEVASAGYGMGMYTEPFGTFNDGSLALRSWPLISKAPPSTRYRDSLLVHRQPAVPGTPTSLVRTGGFEMIQVPYSPRQGMRLAFSKHTESALRGDRLLLARNDRWEVEEYDPDGRLTRLMRVSTPVRPIPPAFIAERARLYKPPATLARMPEALQKSILEWGRRPEYSAAFPPIHSIFVSPDGLLFVLESDDPRVPRTLAVIDADGTLVCRLPVPPDVTIRAVGRSMVYGRTEDADGVVHLVGYRIIRP